MANRSDNDTKGGGLRGPPKRWTGGGPRPARHIPWPELFKHHQSVLTGHLKMMDMVRKHCVEGTGNHDTAKACVERTHEMMRMFKQAIYNFVPPKDNLDRVPLGASSASMYPGYSPADHIYGEAAQEYGELASELKRKGVEMKLDPNGPQYVVGQNKKPRRLSQEPEQAPSTSTSSVNAARNDNQDGEGEPMEGVEQSLSESQYFVIDSKPTPIADLGDIQKQKNKANDKAKRRVSFKEEQEDVVAGINDSGTRRSKKAKITTSDNPAAGNVETLVQEEDISAEVDARLKAKEERRKRKEEKKRKRESGDSLENSQVENPATLADGGVEPSLIEKPKKKRAKEEVTISNEAEPSAKANRVDESKEKKDKKKKKKADADKEVAATSVTAENEKPKKKRKKDVTDPSD